MKTNIVFRMLVAAMMLLPLSGLKAQNFINNYGTPFDENGTTTQTCANGDFIMAGTHFNGADLDMYVVRTTNAGVILWAQWYPMTGTNEELYSIKEAANGDFVMTGYITTGLAGPREVLVHRINAFGIVVWTRAFGDAQDDEGKDIIELPPVFPAINGDLVIVGYSENTLPPINRDYYALCINAAGALIWQTRYPGPAVTVSGDEVAHSVLLNSVTGNLSILGYSDFYTPFPPFYAATLLEVIPATGGAVSLISYDIPGGFDDYGFKLIQLFGPAGPGDLMMLCRTDFGRNPDNIWVIQTNAAGASLMSRVYDYLTDDDPASIVENPIPVPPLGMNTVTFSHVRTNATGVDAICLTNITPLTGAVNWSRQYDQIVYTPADLTHSLDFVPADGGYIQVARSNINTVGLTDFHLVKTNAAGQVFGNIPLGEKCYIDIFPKIDSPIIERQWDIPYKRIERNRNLSTLNVPVGLQRILCFAININTPARKSAPIEASALAGTTVYPNPSDGRIILQFNAEEAVTISVHLYNTTGQLLMVRSIAAGKGTSEESLDLSTYPAGLYLLQVQNGKHTEYHKLMIE